MSFLGVLNLETSVASRKFLSPRPLTLSVPKPHLEYLKDDLKHKKVKAQLACTDIQEEIRKFEKKNLSRKSALIYPQLFGIGRDIRYLSHMTKILIIGP